MRVSCTTVDSVDACIEAYTKNNDTILFGQFGSSIFVIGIPEFDLIIFPPFPLYPVSKLENRKFDTIEIGNIS